MKPVGILLWRKRDRRYRIYCWACFKDDEKWYEENPSRFRYWKIKQGDLGDFSESCVRCEENLNPEARFKTNLFTVTKFVDDGDEGYTIRRTAHMPAPRTIENIPIPIDLVEGTGL